MPHIVLNSDGSAEDYFLGRHIGIDSKVVEQVKSTTDFDNLIAADFTKPSIDAIASSQWDLALFGDILEHVHAPVDFLSAFRANYGSSVNKIIVSVPNNMRATQREPCAIAKRSIATTASIAASPLQGSPSPSSTRDGPIWRICLLRWHRWRESDA